MADLLIDVTDLGGKAHPEDRVVLWKPALQGSAENIGRVISTASVTVKLRDGKAAVSGIEPGDMMVLLQCRGIESQGPIKVVVPEGGTTITLRGLLESQFDYEPPVISAVQSAVDNVAAAERSVLGAHDRVEEWAGEVEDNAVRAVAYAAAAKASETNAATHEANSLSAAERAEFAATETIQQVEGDFATRNYVDDATWQKAPLAASADIDALVPGVYPVPNTAVASGLGLPEAVAGELSHFDLDGSRFHRRQYFRADPLDSPATVYRRTSYLGNWRPWTPDSAGGDGSSHYRGTIPEGLTPEEMIGSEYQGVWTYSSAQAIEWTVPSRAAGFLTVLATRTSTMHEVSTLTTPIQNYQRRWYNGNWSGGWERIGGGDGSSRPAPEPVDTDEYAVATSKVALNALVPASVDPTLSYEVDHAALIADLKTRLGTVSTGGRAAVALVVDHGTTAFKEWMWDALKARGIPCTMALCPETHLDGKGDSRHLATNDDIKQWISEGLVIASHSGDHGGARGYFDVSRQIMTSKQKLQEKLDTAVDCWVQPGYSLALGNYDDFGTGQSDLRYMDYYAGRMLQQTYPVITGYAGSDYVYPGNEDLPVGVRRSLMERKDNAQGVYDYIQQAIDTGGKHINFCHPYALPESSNTYVTKAEYIDFLDWLAAKRDAGDLILLTLPQLAIARP